MRIQFCLCGKVDLQTLCATIDCELDDQCFAAVSGWGDFVFCGAFRVPGLIFGVKTLDLTFITCEFDRK